MIKRLSIPLAALLAIAATSAPDHWVPAWSGPPIGYEANTRDGKALGRAFKDETVRQDMRVGVSGKTLRVRLSNELSDDALRIGGASVVRLDADGKPVVGSLRTLSFSGAKDSRIPARAPMLSDAIDYPVKAGDRLAISLYFPDEAAPPTHAQMVDLVAGDATASAELTDPHRYRASGVVSALEVSGSTATRVVVTFGDSITEGAGSTSGNSWPDQLSRMLAASPGGRCWAVANAGISGNRLVNPGRGPSALSRFDRDVLSVPGVTHVVILEGINDIGKVRDPATQYQAPAAALIAADEQLYQRARAHGIKVIFGTLLPYGGAAYADAAGEERRRAVNAWIRKNAGRFDGVIDFDAVMGEPGQPHVMRLAEQIGDHLHPNDAGYTRMAKAALPVMLRQRCR